MSSKNKEPENRPKERIEQLISEPENSHDRRVHDRLSVEPGTEIYFPILCKGEVLDVSENGLSVRFKPLDAPGLEMDEKLTVHMNLNDRSLQFPAKIRRAESRFGIILIGMEFDPDSIEVKE